MKGILFLEDGTVLHGKGFGAPATNIGELVFNTSMVGYQEVLTDPSYAGQVINLTYPLIGSYGISSEANESERIHAFGLVARNICATPSHFTSTRTLDDWLMEMGIPGVSGVDTRALTRKIRTKGTIKCLISTEDLSYQEAKALCENAILRQDFMKIAGTENIKKIPGTGFKVAVLDFGVKQNILRSLMDRNCDITLFPYASKAEELLAAKPDGIVLTNGPGDPEAAVEAIAETKKLLAMDLPIFGICMGHQIMALAAGGKTFKLKYGHRGSNHGVFETSTGKSFITSQNHGFAVDPESIINAGMEVTHTNLNDASVEGMKDPILSHFSVQFHPEASPGPRDCAYLLDNFITMMQQEKQNA